MTKAFQKILIFTLLSLLLFSCSEVPKRPIETTQENKQITSPAEYRLKQAEQLLAIAMKKKQPEKNHRLLDIVDYLFEEIADLNLPGDTEYSFISRVLNQINPATITSAQYNRYLFNNVKLLLAWQQYEKASVLLDELHDSDYSGILPLSQAEQIEYHRMRLTLFNEHQLDLSAAKELIYLYMLTKNQPELTDIETENPYLQKIWEIMNSFQIQELEQQISSQMEQVDTNESLRLGLLNPELFQKQLEGVQQLIILVKTYTQQYQLDQQLKYWSVKFPNHMFSPSFVHNRLKQRFEHLITPEKIALLLPARGRLAKPAQEIINGFLASHYQRAINNKVEIRLYDSSEHESIWPAYKKAVYDGADMVVGPFNKQFISELSQSDELPVPTLALNNIDLAAGEQINNLYQFALTPEDEVDTITRKARQEGLVKAALITPDSPWGKRLESAFKQSWQNQSGIVVSTKYYPDKTYDYSDTIKQLLQLDDSNQRRNRLRQIIGTDFEYTPRRRQDIDVIFLAAFPSQAKQIPLQITYNHGEGIPVYATSHIIDEAFNQKENKDLNGITYSDMPWLLDKELQVTSRQGRQKRASYQRLFALGVDSYQMIPYLQLMRNNSAEHFSGDTGIIHITESGYIKRQIPTAKIINGTPIINKPDNN